MLTILLLVTVQSYSIEDVMLQWEAPPDKRQAVRKYVVPTVPCCVTQKQL